MNRILHSRLFPTYTIPIVREFLTGLAEKHDVEDALFLGDDTDDLIGGLHRENYSYRVEQYASETSSNVSFKKQSDESLHFQAFSAASIHRPLKSGDRPTPSCGIMLNLTRSNTSK